MKMNYDLDKLKADNLQRCTCEAIGVDIKIKDDAPDLAKAEQDRQELITELDTYLRDFVYCDKCPGCNWTLGGFLGSFTWGLEHGEGFCTNCQYPCRAHHNINGTRMSNVILAYHPSVLELRPETEEVEEAA